MRKDVKIGIATAIISALVGHFLFGKTITINIQDMFISFLSAVIASYIIMRWVK